MEWVDLWVDSQKGLTSIKGAVRMLPSDLPQGSSTHAPILRSCRKAGRMRNSNLYQGSSAHANIWPPSREQGASDLQQGSNAHAQFWPLSGEQYTCSHLTSNEAAARKLPSDLQQGNRAYAHTWPQQWSTAHACRVQNRDRQIERERNDGMRGDVFCASGARKRQLLDPTDRQIREASPLFPRLNN